MDGSRNKTDTLKLQEKNPYICGSFMIFPDPMDGFKNLAIRTMYVIVSPGTILSYTDSGKLVKWL